MFSAQVEQRIDQNKDMKMDANELQHWMRHVYHRDLENTIIEAFNTANIKGVSIGAGSD